jgi:hypothetical protein
MKNGMPATLTPGETWQIKYTLTAGDDGMPVIRDTVVSLMPPEPPAPHPAGKVWDVMRAEFEAELIDHLYRGISAEEAGHKVHAIAEALAYKASRIIETNAELVAGAPAPPPPFLLLAADEPGGVAYHELPPCSGLIAHQPDGTLTRLIPTPGPPRYEHEERCVVSKAMLLGHVAMWAVRQADGHKPKQLETALEMLGKRIDHTFEGPAPCPMLECSQLKLRHWFQFVGIPMLSGYGWNAGMDLDALRMNVVRSVFEEGRNATPAPPPATPPCGGMPIMDPVVLGAARAMAWDRLDGEDRPSLAATTTASTFNH